MTQLLKCTKFWPTIKLASVIEFLEKSSDHGILIATSDHETGGLATARQLDSNYPQYLWHPEVLANASHSSEFLARKLLAEIASGLDPKGKEFTKHINENYVQSGLGIFDASTDELQVIVNSPLRSVYYFADMISRRAQIGWSTHGHSAVDVNIYGTHGSDKLRGNHENTEIGRFLREYLDVDVDEVTKELVENSKSFQVSSGVGTTWTGAIPIDENIQSFVGHHGGLYGKAL